MGRRKSRARAESPVNAEQNETGREPAEQPESADMSSAAEPGASAASSLEAGVEPADVGSAVVATAAPPAPAETRDVPEGLTQARELLERGEVQAAIDAYRVHILGAADDVDARLELARLYEERADWHLALEQYEMARESEDRLEATLGMASALAALGRFDGAERELRRAAKTHPTRADVFATSGLINFRRGLYPQAEQELKRAIELDSDLGIAYFYRGESLNQLSRVDEALEMLEHATRLQPRNARAFYVMGILFDKKGRPQEAAAMYRKAREVSAA